jgi:hypothetical protein
MTRWISTLVGIAGIVCANTAGADTLRRFQISNWQAGAYSPPNSKAFSHCAGATAYNSGVIMLFTVSRTFRWSVGFSDSQWRLTKDAAYDIAFAIDDWQPFRGKATAIGPDHVRVDLGDDIELFNRFKRGRMLRVAAGDQILTFNLAGTSALLPVLLDCVREEVARTSVVRSNPFVTTPAQGSSPGRRDPIYQAEAAALLSNILSAGGVTGFSIGSPENASAADADAVWSVGRELAGRVNVAPDVTMTEYPSVQSAVFGAASQRCKGAFLAGSLPDDAGGPSFRAFTTCQQPKDSATTYYLAIPRPKGGLYVFATVALGTSEAPAKQADANIRAVALRMDERQR